MADTREVIKGLDLPENPPEIMALVVKEQEARKKP